ncbi:MAG: CBS domain-containing protein [Anaerolineaceae bacterium]|nr:CBS domain-containing protein [Anaerolineaceae bacterium]
MSVLRSAQNHPECTPDTSLTEVARRIHAHRAEKVLVYAGDTLVGTITRDDVLRHGERGGLHGMTADMVYRPVSSAF